MTMTMTMTFIEHKYSLQMRIYIKYDLLAIRCYVLYLCMQTTPLYIST